ncbi:hypothetical protein [Noviherbaspirillum sp. ST9]|uniref:hypothetical protein n=1 Tax=Noviherbaspirillum sp. ST9 TaxID=3401606 RepID=UPI003B587FCC
MNKSTLNAIFAAALSIVSFSAFAGKPPLSSEAPDPVIASFDRLLNHPATFIASTGKTLPKADADPLRDSVNAVLWEQPSYHLPAKYALHAARQKQTN